MSVRQLIIGSSGIYLSYLTISLISEKLFSIPYPSIKNPGESNEFTYPSLIVWFSSLFCALFGYVKGTVSNEITNPIPMKEQMLLGLLFTVNMLCANEALLYITYLEQTLGRNSRYLMVVIVGAFFSRVKKGSDLKLPPKKIVVAAVITIGVILFTLLGGSRKHESHLNAEDHWKGYIILGISIIADALFSDNQAYAKVYFKPSSNHLFTSTSFFAFIYVFIFSLLKGELVSQFTFCINHPSVITDVLVMSVLQVVGQISIYYVILNFKQHIFPLISTTRKVFTVLLSILFYGHVLNGGQWLAILFVFGGLAYELFEELHEKKKPKQEAKSAIEQKKEPAPGPQKKSVPSPAPTAVTNSAVLQKRSSVKETKDAKEVKDQVKQSKANRKSVKKQ